MKKNKIFLHTIAMIWASLFSCQSPDYQTTQEPESRAQIESDLPSRVEKAALQELLDSAGLRGSFLVYDPQENIHFSNDFAWAEKGQLPASTYKIPHSIIALETGVVADTNTLFPWDGEPREIPTWEEDLIFKQAFARSCVPCYQEVAREVGVKRMQDWLDKLDYGAMNVDSSNLDRFWLRGASRISPMEQVDFLVRLKEEQLPITERSYALMKEMMFIVERPAYILRGKTGWSNENEHHNGWFVGYLEMSNGDYYYFANNFEPLEGYDMNQFAEVRRALSHRACQVLGMIP